MLNNQSLQTVQNQLAHFASQSNFDAVMATAFGARLDRSKLQLLRQQWLSGNFSIIPNIQVLSQGELGGANGAYGASLDRIFVSSDFLARATESQVTSLILEEVGHRIDQLLNNGVDSAGDEGEIFGRLVEGQSLSAETLAALKSQNDRAVITVGGLQVAIEQETFYGSNNVDDTILGGLGNDSIFGGAISGVDTGYDTLDGSDGNDYIYGDGGGDVLYGGRGNDTLDGGLGNDTLYGGFTYLTFENGYDDTLNGGSGDDYYQIILGYDNDSVQGSSTIVEASGVDRISVDSSTRSVSIDLSLTVAQSILIGGPNNFILAAQSLSEIEELYGGSGNDTLKGNSLGNVIFGRSGRDVLNGGAGNDKLYGFSVNDTLSGGNDTLSGDDGDDTLFSGGRYNNDGSISGYQYLYGGAGNDRLEGDDGWDLLYGGDGDDILYSSIGDSASAKGGRDFLDGGNGNDTLIGGINSTYIYSGFLSEDYDILDGGSGDDLLDARGGNDFASGGDGNDTVDGGDGKDNISGDNGDDSIYGGDGNDSVTGGTGDDTVSGDSGNDSISGEDGSDYLAGGSGGDTILGGIGDDYLSGGSDRDSLDGGAGNDEINGGDSDDTLMGGLGIDTMVGGTDNDLYFVDNIGDVIIENSFEGKDQVNSSVSYSLGNTLENLTLQGTVNINGTGNSLNNKIIGNSGINALCGKAGNDTLIGADGNDVYIIDADVDLGLDIITESTIVTGGIDTIDLRTSAMATKLDLTALITQTIATGVQLAAIGAQGIENVYGGSGNDTIIGNAANNVFIGGAGSDSITGGLGNELYIIDADVDLGTDTLIELVAGGIDSLDFRSTTTKAITLNLDLVTNQLVATGVNLMMPSGQIEYAYGGSLNDNLIGNSLNNYFIGGAGNDTLKGGIGSDYLTGGIGNDTFCFQGVALTGANNGTNTVATALGRDTISDFVVGTDKIALSKATFAALTSAVGGAIGTADFVTVTNDTLAGGQSAAIVYSTSSGNLFYNSDGIASGGTGGLGINGGNFAVLSKVPLTVGGLPVLPVLLATDFAIVA
jgi:Ca2+-binding RTX toxin-like protein